MSHGAGRKGVEVTPSEKSYGAVGLALNRSRIASDQVMAYAASAAAVTIAALVARGILALAALPHVSVIFLCAVIVSGIRWGRGPALFAAVLSVAIASYYFYPPIYSFAVASPQDVLDLLIFSFAAVLTSALAEEIRRQRIAAEQHDAMTAKLYGFSRGLAGVVDPDELFRVIVETLSEVLGSDVALIVPRNGNAAVRGCAGMEEPPRDVVRAALAMAQRSPPADAGTNGVPGWQLRPLRRAEREVAVLAFPDGERNAGNSDLLDALVGQAAVAIERSQLAAEIEDARVMAKTEELREALLNSVSHDLQTPLAAIIGSATSLQSFGTLEEREAEAELVATIREEGDRLNTLIGNILDSSRIRAGAIHPRLEIVELADIVNAALQRAERTVAGHDVTVDLPDDLPMLSLDLFLMERTLVNLLENAAKYSPKGSRIGITARLVDRDIVLEVRDEGVGIATDDLPNVFDQFFRARLQDTTSGGSGLGLSICRAFVEANHGRITAASGGAGAGATFRITLPSVEHVDAFGPRDE